MNFKYAVACAMLLGLCACGGPGPAPKPPYAGIKIGRPYEVYGRWYEPKYNAHYDEIGVASWYGPGFHGGHTASGERFDQNAMTAAHKTLPLPSIVRVTNLDNGVSAIIKVNDRGPFSKGRIIDLSRGAAVKLGVIRTGTAKVRVQFLEKETKEYVQNLNGGTQYAMRAINNVDPDEAGAREEEGAKPTMRIETRMFPGGVQKVAANQPNEFSVVDNANTAPVQVPPPPAAPPVQHAPQRAVAARATAKTASEGLTAPAYSSFFVQAGTFSTEDNALELMDKLSDNDAPQVMEVMLGGKKFYRVMVGPYEARQDAKNMLSKLASIGISDAKIIRN
jgi:rare lipoprotein A